MSSNLILRELCKHKSAFNSGCLVGRRNYGRAVEYHAQLKTRTTRFKEQTDREEELIRRRSIPLPPLESIKIPKRIERGPTDILKALASTVGRDYTAPSYRFHDDPYLIPMSNPAKRNYALSKESGKKAAKWIRQEHADLFQHREAEPPVQAFIPTPVFTEESNVTEEDLLNLVRQGLLFDAVTVYKIMKSKGNDLSNGAKQEFLELLCYSNENELMNDELIEERWYKAGQMSKERPKNTWKDRGLAESLFQELEQPDIKTYCALIRGRAKFYQVEKAWQLYQEVLGKGLSLDVETYNHLIKVVNFLKESSDLRWELIQDFLTEMKEHGVEPNVRTLNAVLETLSTLGNPKQARNLCMQTLSEFNKLGIEPSPASYHFVLHIFCKDKGPPSTILADILKELNGKQLVVQDPKDVLFFVTAMEIARHHLQSLEMAEAINQLLLTGDNYDLIGDSFKESVYYRHYVALKCNLEQFDSFMKFYDMIVPNIYTPEPGIMEEILNAMEVNSAIQYLPRFWSDIVIFDHTSRESLLCLVLNIMSNNFPVIEEGEVSSESAALANSFAQISWKIWGIIETQDRERQRLINWSGKMLGDLLTIQVKAGKFENACEIIKKLVQAQDIVGVPSLESLKLFLETAVNFDHGAMCLACLHYISESGFPEVADFAEEVYEKVKLDAIQTTKLSTIIGYDITSKSRVREDVE